MKFNFIENPLNFIITTHIRRVSMVMSTSYTVLVYQVLLSRLNMKQDKLETEAGQTVHLSCLCDNCDNWN